MSPEQGKIRVKTFCSSKGLEANVVIVINPRQLFGDLGLDNALYVALTRSVKQLIIFQSSQHVTWEDLETLSSVQKSLSVDVHRPLMAVRGSVETPPAPVSYLQADTMFHYVDPLSLETLTKLLDYDLLRHPLSVIEKTLEEDDAYARSMEVITAEGRSVNVRKLTGTALTLAAEYYSLEEEQLPAAVVQLSTRVKNLVDQGSLLLAEKDPSFSVSYQRWCHLQAFGLFAIAIDVDTGFSDKASELTGHAFTMSPFVFRRLDLLLEDVSRFTNPKSKRWYQKLSYKRDKIRLGARPTLVTKTHLFIIFDRPTTTSLVDLAEIGISLALSNCNLAFVSNVLTGELVEVTLPPHSKESFLDLAISSKVYREETPNDQDFLQRFKLN
jgi:hypothetical protein